VEQQVSVALKDRLDEQGFAMMGLVIGWLLFSIVIGITALAGEMVSRGSCSP
jgi:hypothetical protein